MSAIGDKVEDQVSRHAAAAGFVLIAAMFLFLALVAGVGALTVWLAQQIELWAALAIVALGLLGAAGIILGVGAIRALGSEKEARQQSENKQLSRDAMLGALSAFGGSSGPGASGKALLVAALVGLLAGSLLFDDKPSGDKD